MSGGRGHYAHEVHSARTALSWQDEGACRDQDTNEFYLGPTNSTTTTAKKVCAGCPVLEACREWGIAHEPYGVWGGMDEKERVNERRRRVRYARAERDRAAAEQPAQEERAAS